MSELEKTISWSIKSFEELSKLELHDILQLRVDVFVVEQTCPYPEIDGKDPMCFHVLGRDEGNQLKATARIAPPGTIYNELSIGRVATHKSIRGKGIGMALMHESIDYCRKNLNTPTIKIAAQSYLEKFYSDLGFKRISDVYVWDDIDHIDMRLTF